MTSLVTVLTEPVTVLLTEFVTDDSAPLTDWVIDCWVLFAMLLVAVAGLAVLAGGAGVVFCALKATGLLVKAAEGVATGVCEAWYFHPVSTNCNFFELGTVWSFATIC